MEGVGLRPIITTSGFGLAIDPDGFVEFGIGGAAGPVVRSRAPIRPETWTLITAVLVPGSPAGEGGVRLMLYVGGGLHAQLRLTAPVVGLQSDSDLYIGLGGPGEASYFDGLIDDIDKDGVKLGQEIAQLAAETGKGDLTVEFCVPAEVKDWNDALLHKRTLAGG